MKLKVILLLALKNLWSNKSRMFITVIGVTIGVSAIIFLVSLGYGLEKLVTQQVASFSAFTVIDIPSSGSNNLKIDDQLIEKIVSLGHIEVVAPVSNIAGRIRKAEQDSTAETVVTSGNSDYWKLAEFKASTGSVPYSENEIAINRSALKMIGEDEQSIVGKELVLNILVPENLMASGTSGGISIDNQKLKVVGVLPDESSPVVLISNDLLKKNLVKNHSSLKIQVDDSANVANTRSQLDSMGFTTEYVGDTLSEISKVFSLFRAILAGFGMIALIVAALGTFNTLTISLMERTREVGLFKSLGMKNRDIYKLFLAEAMVIGLLGGLLGLLLGLAMSNGINLIISVMANRSGSQVIQLFSTPLSLSFIVAGLSILIGFLTGWYPSRRAVKIDPLEAMRYE